MRAPKTWGRRCGLPRHTHLTIGHIDKLGVRPPWKWYEIAVGLLQRGFGELYHRGLVTVAPDVDAESLTGATRPYAKAAMHIRQAEMEYQFSLREGKDLSTRTAG